MRFAPCCSDRRRPGITAPTLAISLIAIFGVMAVAIDGGLMLADRHRVEAAADAAALAAAIDLFQNWQTNKGVDANGTAAASAQATAKDNGFADGVNSVSVTVNIPPQSGAYQAQPGYAEVIITMQEQRFFSNVLGSGTIQLAGRAVARGTMAGKNNGIIILDPKSSNALTTTNTANITVTNGNIIVDSSDAKGATISNSGNISAVEMDFTGNPGYFSSGTGQFIGKILSNQAPTPDPLANLPPPPQMAPNFSNINISALPKIGSGVPGWPSPGDPNGWTLPAGTYNNGLHISDNISSHTYTLQSGMFCFKGGGLSLSGNAAIKSAPDGVLLYFNSGGALNISAGGPVTLSPLQYGPYANITIYQDRSNTSQDSITGQSTGSLNITGTVYTPAAQFTLTGAGANYAIGSQYIVYDLVVTGSGTFNVVYNGPQIPPDRDLYLVE
jgi:hypothetical protein